MSISKFHHSWKLKSFLCSWELWCLDLEISINAFLGLDVSVFLSEQIFLSAYFFCLSSGHSQALHSSRRRRGIRCTCCWQHAFIQRCLRELNLRRSLVWLCPHHSSGLRFLLDELTEFNFVNTAFWTHQQCSDDKVVFLIAMHQNNC